MLARLAAILALAASAQTRDIKGGKDHPLLTRIPGYHISAYEAKEFDSLESPYLSGADARWEGRLTKISYESGPGTREMSMLQVARNYANAMRQAGANILHEEGRVVIGKFTRKDATAYAQAEAFNEGRSYQLTIVEKGDMRQDAAADASGLRQSIASTGKAAVYGIYFDTGRAVVKPESEPTLAEIVKLLKQDARLKLYVVGHTDDTGALEANVKLSADRAAAVTAALAARGVDAARLKPAGSGPYSPAASNRTEEGRAKNRRVELVERIQP